MKIKKQVKRPGDIFAIPLGGGRYGFACLFHHGLSGIYEHTSASIEDIPKNRRFLFMTAIVVPAMNAEGWPVVGMDVVAKGKTTELPLQFIYDEDADTYCIYVAETGEKRPSSKQDCAGLEKVAAWGREHIVARILSGGRHPWLEEGLPHPKGIEYDSEGRFHRFDLQFGNGS